MLQVQGPSFNPINVWSLIHNNYDVRFESFRTLIPFLDSFRILICFHDPLLQLCTICILGFNFFLSWYFRLYHDLQLMRSSGGPCNACEKVNNSFFLSCQIHWCVAMSLFIIIPWGDDEQHYNEKGSDPYTKSSGLVMISWWMIVLPSVERDREKEWVVPFSCFARMALDKLQEASVLMSLFIIYYCCLSPCVTNR